MGLAVRETRLSEQYYQAFVRDVVEMLRGQSNRRTQDGNGGREREQERSQQAYDLGRQVSMEVTTIIDDYVATRLVPATKQFGAVLKSEWEKAPQATEAQIVASWSIVINAIEEFARRTLRVRLKT
jgi:hypothetical protein